MVRNGGHWGHRKLGHRGGPRLKRDQNTGGGPVCSWSVKQSKHLDKLLHVSPEEFLVILGAGAWVAALLEFSLCVLGPAVKQ